MEKLTGWGTKLKSSSTLNFSRQRIIELYEQMLATKNTSIKCGMTYTAKNRLLWTTKTESGSRERRFGIPMYDFQFPVSPTLWRYN
ncbi:hypothetical protein OK016_19515 [Vibrio chagasii]|nr:hypothetical protein [Vibrio chagasii]